MTTTVSFRTALIAVVVGVVAAGLVTFVCQGPTEPNPRVDSQLTTLGGASASIVLAPLGPTGADVGVPVGWRHDAVGATAAATAFVNASQLVATSGPLTRRDVVLAMAAPDRGAELVETTNGQLDDLLFSLGELDLALSDLVWSEHALTVDTTSVTDDEVVVRVWSVLVIAAGEGSVPRQVWRTSTIALIWTDGDWKVDSWATTPGPLPAPPAEIDVSTAGAVAEVTLWARPVLGGVS